MHRSAAVTPGTLGLLTAIALAARLPGLDAGLWYDEYVTLIEAVRAPVGQILTSFPWNNDHKLYSLLAHLSIGIFGESAWSLRLPALAFGVACVPMLYVLARRVLSDRVGRSGPMLSAGRTQAFWAALVLAVFAPHVAYSQNARGYTALMFWVLAATWLFLRAIDEQRPRLFVAYGVVGGLGAYSHLTMIPIVASHAAIWGWWIARSGPSDRAGRLRLAATGVGVAAGLTLLAYAPLIGDMSEFFLTPSEGRALGTRVATPTWMLAEAVRGLGDSAGAPEALGFWVGAAALLIGLVVLGAGLWRVRECSGRYEEVLLFTLPAVFVVALAIVLRRPMYPRFFFFMAGFGLITGIAAVFFLIDRAWNVGRLRTRLRLSPRTAAIGVVAALTVVLALRLPALYRLPKQDFQGALAFLEEREQLAPILTVGLATYPFARYYGRGWPEIASVDELRDALGATGRAWLVYTFPMFIEASDPELMHEIAVRCDVERRFPASVRGGELVVSQCAAAGGLAG